MITFIWETIVNFFSYLSQVCINIFYSSWLVKLWWISYIFEILFCIAIILLVLMQKTGEGIIAKNSFGPITRTNTAIRLTYIFIFAFFLNTLVLGIVSQYQHKQYSLQILKKKNEAA